MGALYIGKENVDRVDRLVTDGQKQLRHAGFEKKTGRDARLK